jgi:hypothetical protein
MAIWRYPLKSAQGESLNRVFFGVNGPHGDRAWACIGMDGTVVSAKNPRRWGRLLEVSAALRPGVNGEDLWVQLPGFEPVVAGTRNAEQALSRFLGEEVRIANEVPGDARLGRVWPSEVGMIPDWNIDARPGQESVAKFTSNRSDARFVDFGAVHIVTTDELADLEHEGVEVDVRRFRPNLVLSLDRALEVGDRIQIGEHVTMVVSTPTPRCAIPGAKQPGLPRAPELLRALGRRRSEAPRLGRAATFGCYADVVTTGTVRVGDLAFIQDRVTPRTVRARPNREDDTEQHF